MASVTTSPRNAAPADWEAWSKEYRGKIAASIVLPVAWLCFTLLYVGFWASGFSLFQSIVILLVSAILLGGTMGLLWVWWAPYRTLPAP